MSNLVDNDVNCAVYRSNDPINNFKIRQQKKKLEIFFFIYLFLFRVILEHLTSNALLPSLQRTKIEEDLSRLLKIDEKEVDKSKTSKKDEKEVDKNKASKTDVAQALEETKKSEYEEVIVGWQQKLFNRV